MMQIYFLNSMIDFRAKSKKTILAFTFCSMCLSAKLSSSIKEMIFLWLIKGEKFVEKATSEGDK